MASLLFAPGTSVISSQYLPTGGAPTHPYVENPMVQPLDGGNQAISNVATLVVNSSIVPSGSTAIIAGGNIECEDLFVNGGSIECDNQPLVLQGTANAPMGYPNPTVLVGGGSVLQANTGLVVGSAVIPGQTKVAQFAGDIELTSGGELFCSEINTTSSANVNYLSITQGAGAEVSCNAITTTTSDDLCLITGGTGNKVYACDSGNAAAGPFYEVLTVKARGTGTLAGDGTGSTNTVVNVPPLAGGLTPGIQTGDIILITPFDSSKLPTGNFYAGGINNGVSFNVASTQNADFGCQFNWVVLPAP